jgi:hypothetical protein
MSAITQDTPSGPSLEPAQFLQFGKERSEALMNVQKELLKAYQDAGETWLARMKSEIDLWTELAGKLSESRTLPEGLKAYSDSVSQRLQIVADDGRRMVEDAQKLMAAFAGSLNGGRK